MWGRNSYSGSSGGMLGDNTILSKSSPIQTITGGTNWSSVACGYFHTAAIKKDGTLWNWGVNAYGELGDNTTVHRSSPIQTITGGTNWSKVYCGNYNTAAIKTDGTLWMWGYNYAGSLGDNTATRRSSPIQTIAGGTNWKQISCKTDNTAAIKTDGTLWIWGKNYYGQLGNGNTAPEQSSPIQVGGNNWKQIAVGQDFTAAIRDANY